MRSLFRSAMARFHRVRAAASATGADGFEAGSQRRTSASTAPAAMMTALRSSSMAWTRRADVARSTFVDVALPSPTTATKASIFRRALSPSSPPEAPRLSTRARVLR